MLPSLVTDLILFPFEPLQNEVFASRHQDQNSVACIEEKCYVLTFAEYCRWAVPCVSGQPLPGAVGLPVIPKGISLGLTSQNFFLYNLLAPSDFFKKKKTCSLSGGEWLDRLGGGYCTMLREREGELAGGREGGPGGCGSPATEGEAPDGDGGGTRPWVGDNYPAL